MTPNVPEAEYITGMPIRSEADFPAAAAALRDMGAGAVLLKAGHLDGTELTEYLFDGNGCHTFRYPRTDTPNTHGTGCTLSSAIASHLALGEDLPTAVDHAKLYLTGALEAQLDLGHGSGPMDHAWRWR